MGYPVLCAFSYTILLWLYFQFFHNISIGPSLVQPSTPEFEVLSEVSMKTAVFGVATPCILESASQATSRSRRQAEFSL
jgi:hypothetical protein